MRLLITTQAVDLDDPVLGFMHRWIEVFATQYDSIDVICLKGGRYSLPAKVRVYSLGKERGVSRVAYILNFYRYIWKLRGSYDAVFVHMNQEYVLLGGFFWKLFGKQVVLWRNHKKGSWMTGLAAMLADTVCYTSPAAYVAHYQNAVMMPIGIDTDFFKPAKEMPPSGSILFLGRLDPVKRTEVFIAALQKLRDDGVVFSADIIGDPTPGNEQYAHDVRNKAAPLVLEGGIQMLPGVNQEAARELFANHAIYVNLTPSGSFDKTIGEAMASGCVVVVRNSALRAVVPGEYMLESDDAESVAQRLRTALAIDDDVRRSLMQRSRDYILCEHSLSLLADKLAGLTDYIE